MFDIIDIIWNDMICDILYINLYMFIYFKKYEILSGLQQRNASLKSVDWLVSRLSFEVLTSMGNRNKAICGSPSLPIQQTQFLSKNKQ